MFQCVIASYPLPMCKTVWSLVLVLPIAEDFGFKHILWVFSGRRGVHCWVCDAKARRWNSLRVHYRYTIRLQREVGELCEIISIRRSHQLYKKNTLQSKKHKVCSNVKSFENLICLLLSLMNMNPRDLLVSNLSYPMFYLFMFTGQMHHHSR